MHLKTLVSLLSLIATFSSNIFAADNEKHAVMTHMDMSASASNDEMNNTQMQNMGQPNPSLIPKEENAYLPNMMNDDIHHMPSPQQNMADMDISHDMSNMNMSGASNNKLPDRSPDYSNGYLNNDHRDMHIRPQWAININQLEANLSHPQPDNHATLSSINLEGWYGSYANRAVVRLEGDMRNTNIQEGASRLSWRHPLSPFWNGELGLERQRFEHTGRTWAVGSITGIIPYWIYSELTAKISNDNRTAIQLAFNYNWRLTQRWIVQPQIEWSRYFHLEKINLMPVQQSQLGLRLLYKVTPQIYPYVGYTYQRDWYQNNQYYDYLQNKKWVSGIMFWF